MEKLYFLTPDLTSTHAIVNDLRAIGIGDQNIHLVANDQTTLEELPEASMLKESDLIPALQRGAAIGGATGLLAGLAAVAIPPAGLVFGGGAILATTLAGAGFGAWASSMMGVSTPNSHLQQFEEAIAQGQILVLVETEADRVEEIQQLVRRHHPEADIKGTQDTLPPLT